MFFADSRLWLGANLRCLRLKRVALGGDIESFWKKKSFWRAEISSFQVQLEKFSAKGNVFVLRKRRLFLFMQGNAKMKSLL